MITREELETEYGEVLTTDEMTSQYDVHAFTYGLVEVTRKSDGVRGTLMFHHMPRYYFRFRALSRGPS